ncbi:hypothetical protein C6N75_01205 [Streptomyces solincola]|uniref:Uncharacterized protein n=1 Tax=Streptomyces solincola TaxID=2100817 RepID=A0A2S9Q2S6_9ACTN|nr:hypothetical protein [Streptomyces solincola]PRH80971.1 hypothetical protein C6N75_01205 [Streptomyces solincola]
MGSERASRLMRGGTLVGELEPAGIDQPFFLYAFAPGPGWPEVAPLFDAWNALPPHDPEERLMERAMDAVSALGLTLAPPGGGRALAVHRECVVRIEEGREGLEATVRYWVRG